jgi:glycosyltransferase involved in cell wall biosynthesis
MNVAIVSKSGARGGGASRFAEDLTAWLNSSGNHATHFVARSFGELRSFQQPLYKRGLKDRLVLKSNQVLGDLGLKEWLAMDGWLCLQHRLHDFDIVHFHDHYSAFSAKGMKFVAKSRPVLFTAHDCLHFTGGCLYPMGCERFIDNCGSCPQKSFIGRFDLTRINQKAHRQVAAHSLIQYIYPSVWLKERAENTLNHRLIPIHTPYGFDPEPYRYPTRLEARRQLNLPVDRPVVIVSAHDLEDKRKGAAYALEAIRSSAHLNPVVAFVGREWRNPPVMPATMTMVCTGYLSEKEDLGRWYAAADVFLFPTLEDNLPISVQESMAAGTPVVGFATGGVPEMVESGIHGWLVETGDQPALNKALHEALCSKDELRARGAQSRLRVLNHFSVKECVNHHLEIYARHQARRKRPHR